MWQAADVAGVGAAVRRAASVPGAYLSAYLIGVLITATVVRLTQQDYFRAVPLAVPTALLTVVVSLLLWWRDLLPRAREGLLPWFLIALLALWIYLVAASVLREEELAIPVLMLPIMVALVAYRTPTGLDAIRVAEVLAWAVIAVSLVTLVFESVGVIPHYSLIPRDIAATRFTIVQAERDLYFLPLADLLGIQGRWAGPFGHPNLAGPVGGFLIILGATRRGVNRVAFVGAGVVILLLTASRSALVAAVAGLVILAGVVWLNRPGRLPRRTRLLLLCIPGLLAVAAVVTLNPGFSGRSLLWPQILELWRASPLVGIGDSGFTRAIASGTLPDWGIHAHNVLLDAGVRTGLGGFALALAVMVLAVVIAVGAARRGDGLGLALVGMLVVASMTDAVILWRYLTANLAVLVLAVLISARVELASAVPIPRQQPVPEQGSDPDRDPEPSP